MGLKILGTHIFFSGKNILFYALWKVFHLSKCINYILFPEILKKILVYPLNLGRIRLPKIQVIFYLALWKKPNGLFLSVLCIKTKTMIVIPHLVTRTLLTLIKLDMCMHSTSPIFTQLSCSVLVISKLWSLMSWLLTRSQLIRIYTALKILYIPVQHGKGPYSLIPTTFRMAKTQYILGTSENNLA